MSVIADLKPFSVVKGKYLFWFAPAEEGGFTVTCQNVQGVNAEGDTFEEALTHAVSMAAFVEECQADIAAGRKSGGRIVNAAKSARKPRQAGRSVVKGIRAGMWSKSAAADGGSRKQEPRGKK